MLLCDAHNHLLHNMGSGAATLDESLTMARALYVQGVRYAIVCPAFHESFETVNRFLTRRNEARKQLLDAFGVGEKRVRLICSAEVTLSEELASLPDLPKLLIPGTNFLPISLSIPSFGDQEVRLISYLIHKKGILPYFLHLERYISFFSTAQLDRLLSIKKGVFCLSVRALGERDMVTLIQKYLVHGSKIIPMTNAHNLTTMPPEVRPEQLRIDGLHAERVYHLMERISSTIFKPYLPAWRRSRSC